MELNQTHNDQELFRLIALGDQDAFATLFRTYSNPLYKNALRMLKSEFWAEEIIQVVFTQLWQNRFNLEKVETPAAYLFRMVTNKARDRMRSHEREMKMQYWLAAQGNEETGTGQKADQETLHQLLEKAVNTLSPQRKEVYLLKYQERLSYEEIAQKLGISKNTVRNHMTRALEEIRLFLQQHADLICLILYCSFF
ncbi:RNA polymerase sigma-70 factor [Pseudoflavitalea rhizosphaerae]|uniref:RNA polymerase sigma-70 factor n=1 Tax=Pseudoflavitalea rhizosphaerae TaxID=1884793 RepID=UPI0013DE8F7F